MTLDDALKTFTNTGSSNINQVTGLELSHGQRITNVQLIGLIEFQFTQVPKNTLTSLDTVTAISGIGFGSDSGLKTDLNCSYNRQWLLTFSE